MEKQARKEIKRIVNYFSALCGPGRYEPEAYRMCVEAYRKGDTQRIDWIRTMGADERYIIRNIGHHLAGKRFGFDLTQIGKYGWLETAEFLDVEEIAFKVGDEKYNYNNIKLGRGPNGKWTFAMAMHYSLGGCSYGLTVFNRLCDSQQSATNQAIAELRKHIVRQLGRNDNSRSDVTYLNKVLGHMKTYEGGLAQLTLF